MEHVHQISNRRFGVHPTVRDMLYPSQSLMNMSHHQNHSPPPPNYPQHCPSTSMSREFCSISPDRLNETHFVELNGEVPNDYSYAYYVPGPPTRHDHVPCIGPDKYREGSFRAKHTYLTRYGTEENIYEEINEFARARLRSAQHQDSIVSLNQSLVEEEVRRVQSGHRRVLGELNLSVEAMLMPTSMRESDETERGSETEDQLADLLTIGPTDDLLSPAAFLDLDSGFSGSSSGASYRSAGGSLKRGPNHSRTVTLRSELARPHVSSTQHHQERPESGSFWAKKTWKKLTGFPSSISLNKSKDEPHVRSSGRDSTIYDQKVTSPGSHPRNLQMTVSQKSSEESWCTDSDPEELSYDEEEYDKDSNRSNGQLRNTFNKARTLCDKLRGSGGRGSSNRLSLDGVIPSDANPQSQSYQGRLSRWFSIRRGSAYQYDLENVYGSRPLQGPNAMPLLPEVEEENFANCLSQHRRQIPPSLPSPAPPNLHPQQLKRRMIVSAIIHSENSYVATLQRLVNDYKKPLEESSPAILSGSKISTLFHKLPEILQCHTLFRIALAESIRTWDQDEKIGDVFVASFSKAIVLDIYSGFINNFSVAMDLAKSESKRKSALSDFFKVKQIRSDDRLSFFGLMVKPVQRFPQFILFLQDLLKHTPKGHHDRMSLQLALTQLESLAEMLNERKREAEQYQAFKEMLRHITSKFSARPLSDCNRYLLREDNVMQLEFNQSGMIVKAKHRRLLLLNDLVVCVAVSSKNSDNFSSNERLSLKWSYPVCDVEIQDTSVSPTLSRVLTAGSSRGGSIKSNSSSEGSHRPQDTNNLCADMSNLMQDYEIMSRIADLVGSLKGTYENVTLENTRRTLSQIQTSIQRKDEEMLWIDSCCLQLLIKVKGKEELFTFKTENPSIKKEWITELRLAQLALNPNNSPAWDIPEQEQRPSTKMPLFVKAQCVNKSQHQTDVRCGCYYTVNSPNTARRRPHVKNYLWICTTDGASSHISVLSQHHQQRGVLKDVTSFSLVETQITAMEFVKGVNPPCPTLASDLVWMGTDSHTLLIYAGSEPEKQEEVMKLTLSDAVTQIKFHCDKVYVALNNGTLNIYSRSIMDNTWMLQEPICVSLGSESVSSLLPINTCLYAACGKKVWVLSGATGEVVKNFSTQHEHVGSVNLMAHSGIGLWISLKHSSTICLYHTETFKHLQDINIASNVMRVTSPSNTNRDCMENNRSHVNVTALLACKGLLWVGTNVGIALTIPLPRLEGVPIISGRVNISYHAHFGPISFLLALQPKSNNNILSSDYSEELPKDNLGDVDEESSCFVKPPDENSPSVEKTPSDSTVPSKLRYFTSSPIVSRRRRSKDCDISRLSKTLPRSFGIGGSIFSTASTSSHGSGDTCDVYGLYGELMYVKDYEGTDVNASDSFYESLRRSDPELAAIPNKVSTLDRKLQLKTSRPRSLDLSNWSVNSSLCTSSGSEESMVAKHACNASVSRNASNASRPSVPSEDKSQKEVHDNIKRSISKSVKVKNSAADSARRTIITLIGGRGYVNFRQPCCSGGKARNTFSIKESNRNDAHIVVWELKL